MKVIECMLAVVDEFYNEYRKNDCNEYEQCHLEKLSAEVLCGAGNAVQDLVNDAGRNIALGHELAVT